MLEFSFTFLIKKKKKKFSFVNLGSCGCDWWLLCGFISVIEFVDVNNGFVMGITVSERTSYVSLLSPNCLLMLIFILIMAFFEYDSLFITDIVYCTVLIIPYAFNPTIEVSSDKSSSLVDQLLIF